MEKLLINTVEVWNLINLTDDTHTLFIYISCASKSSTGDGSMCSHIKRPRSLGLRDQRFHLNRAKPDGKIWCVPMPGWSQNYHVFRRLYRALRLTLLSA
jgi:hypothetical protein